MKMNWIDLEIKVEDDDKDEVDKTGFQIIGKIGKRQIYYNEETESLIIGNGRKTRRYDTVLDFVLYNYINLNRLDIDNSESGLSFNNILKKMLDEIRKLENME